MEKHESKNLEFKVDISSGFLKTVSAFANYVGGRIIFGMSDEGEIQGLSDLDERALAIENSINDNISPMPPYVLNINRVDSTIVLEVQEGPYKPYLYKNRAYKRNDTATVEVDRLEYNRLILEGRNQTYEELPAKNQDLSFRYLEEKLVEKLSISELNEDILKTLELYSLHIGYNRVAELLADKNSYVGLDMVRFGENINELFDRETYEKTSILKQYEQAIQLFKKYYQYELIDGIERTTIEKIPEQAFREALANAIVHRTWDIDASIRISMFKDKIEIVSPGGLMPGISREEYLQGQISLLRNPIICNIFFRLKYIEKFGTGIRRINLSYENNVIKPEYVIYENSISVTLPVLDQAEKVLTVDEKLIFDLISGDSLTRTQIEARSHMNKDKVIRVLNALIGKNVIERIGVGRGVKYRRM